MRLLHNTESLTCIWRNGLVAKYTRFDASASIFASQDHWRVNPAYRVDLSASANTDLPVLLFYTP